MGKYNRMVFYENVKRIMNSRNITQQNLADVLGCAQSRVQHCIPMKTDTPDSDFTLEQAVAVADYFGVTLDSLLTDPEAQKEKSTDKPAAYLTLGEFYRDLFGIELKFNGLVKIKIESSHGKESAASLSFDNCEINEMLTEWIEMQCLKDSPKKTGIIDKWKDGTIAEGQKFTIEHNFESPSDFCVRIARIIVQAYSSIEHENEMWLPFSETIADDFINYCSTNESMLSTEECSRAFFILKRPIKKIVYKN